MTTNASKSAVVLDQARFEEACELLGPDLVASFLLKLGDQMKGSFSEAAVIAADRASLGRLAHGMISASGFLGFSTLSSLCMALDQACVGGGEIEVLRAAVLRARHDVADRLLSLGPPPARL